MNYEKARDEAAESRSKRQNSSGDELLDKAISRYLKIGFEAGSDFGRSYEQKLNADLLADCKAMKQALEFYISECEPLMTEYVGELPNGGYQKVIGTWDLAEQTLSQLKGKYDE